MKADEMQPPDELQKPVKDEDQAHPIATAWRPALREIVKAFVRGDFGIAQGIPSVAPISAAKAVQIRAYIADYGETLVELPDETWNSSVAQWIGPYWDVIVDLWTVESGSSDLVLTGRVFETENGFRIEVRSVHVP